MSRLSQIYSASNSYITTSNNRGIKRRLEDAFVEQEIPKSQRFVLPKLEEGDSFYGLYRLEQFREQDEDNYKLFHKKHCLQTRSEISSNPLRDIGHSDGDRKLAKIRYWLNHLGQWTRSIDQIKFHDAFLVACLPHIYGKDWNACGARVLAEFGLTEVEYEVLCQTPRRFGKTTSVGMFAAVVGYVCPGLKISIFSTGSRASKGMVDMILKFMKYLPGGMERKIKQSKEELMFSAIPLGPKGGPGSQAARTAESADDTTVIKSYPCSVDSKLYSTIIKHVSGEIVYLCVCLLIKVELV
jgi:hypothetical protein